MSSRTYSNERCEDDEHALNNQGLGRKVPKDGLPRVLLLAVATGFSASTSGEPEEGLSEIEWDELFAILKKSKLSFL